MWRREERCILDFDGETLGERDPFEDPGEDGRIILRWNIMK